MECLGTLLVSTVEIKGGVRVACSWNGGPSIVVMIDDGGMVRRAAEWPIWNDAWDCPLIDVSRESFERFIVARLSESGVVDELIESAAA